MTRPTTEGCMSIDVRSWHREGRLRPGQRFARSLTWMWEPTEEIEVLTKADAVILMFRSRSWGGEYGPTIKQRIPIVWTPCTLGGSRPWFRCEVCTNRGCCGRRGRPSSATGECSDRGSKRSVRRTTFSSATTLQSRTSQISRSGRAARRRHAW